MANQKKYWKGIEQVEKTPEFLIQQENEFAQELPIDEFLNTDAAKDNTASRRDFLKFLGFTTAAATLAACEAPVVKSVPYLIKPEEITPGKANWYASAYYDGHDYCDVLIKTREGRPIKIEGNKKSKLTKGGVNARVHASVLSLYDSARIKGPVANKKEYDWDSVDNTVIQKLNAAANAGKKIAIISSTVISPATNKVISDFAAKYPTTVHITYDAISYSAIADANEKTFGKRVIPSYDFSKANVIVSFAADFLGNWLSSTEYASQYAQARRVSEKKDLSLHIQLETNLSLTGSNADKRFALKPADLKIALVSLYNSIAQANGVSGVSVKETEFDAQIKEIASALISAKGKSLVVCGNNDIHMQLVCNEINKLLGNYNNTINLSTPLHLKKGKDSDIASLIDEMKAGNVGVALFYNANPAYTLPKSFDFESNLKNVDYKISFADRLDETAMLCDVVCPDSHPFESWNDALPKAGHFAISQPVINPLFNTRQAQESLLKWAGVEMLYYDYLRKYWQENIFTKQTEYTLFDSFWVNSLQQGVFYQSVLEPVNDILPKAQVTTEVEQVPFSINDSLIALANAANKENFDLVLYEKISIGNGQHANNPWLQEFPDPISKVTWDNYVTMSPQQMKSLGLNVLQGEQQKADVVKVTINGESIELPVVAQPGQKIGTIGIALGYGRKNAGKTANNLGVNVYPFAVYENGTIQYMLQNVSISASVGKYQIASTQTHHTMMGRAIVKETTLHDYVNDPASGNEKATVTVKKGRETENIEVDKISLWQAHESPGHLWNLSIDLNACIGCGACAISCHAENNVPVVGKDEIRRTRDMFWLRIDRYYSSDAEEGNLREMEIPSENPEVVFQPVMCQHCNNAPCETVCPVIATSHSTEGLNQMTYNRCVGTRYCANNCPYKVRRFNWFNYFKDEKFVGFNPSMDDLSRMVLNPDVVVRSRGVIEKCSMCVQRIQEGKLNAKLENRELNDGEIQTACSQSCPTNAIVFGDVNNPNTEVRKRKDDERSYLLLEEVGIRPNVFYQTKVRNKQHKA